MIGGSGFYALARGRRLGTAGPTPYGPPSAPSPWATWAVVRWRSCPGTASVTRSRPAPSTPGPTCGRSGTSGVRRVIGPCAVGSLRADIGPGDVVVLDQLLDRTWGRADTYLEGDVVEHVSFADPYCPELRSVPRGRRGSMRRPGPWRAAPCTSGGRSWWSRALASPPGPISLVPRRRRGRDQHDPVPARPTWPASWASVTPAWRWSPTATSASRATRRRR